MKQFFSYIVLAISSLIISQITLANTYCSEHFKITLPDSRYKLLNNGTEVKDKETGLIWRRCSLGQSWNGKTCTGTAKSYNWQQALSKAQSLGHGYRLPNIKELYSLVEERCDDPSINLNMFPNTPSLTYWSSSPLYTVSFFRGGTTDYYAKDSHFLVRPVRLE